jgi:hypothetical protein
MATLQHRMIDPQHGSWVHLALHAPHKLTKAQYAQIVALYPWLNGLQCTAKYCKASIDEVIPAVKE